MNWHLNRLNVEWIFVVSLSVIPWMLDLSGELSHAMINGSITAILTPRNSVPVSVNLPKSSLKKSVRPQSNVCLVEFWRCDLLEVCSKRACSWHESLFSTSGTSSWNFETEIPSISQPKYRILLQQDNARLHNARTTMNGRNRTAIIPSIQLWSSAFRLPCVSIHGPFLTWKKFRKHWSCGSGSQQIFRIKSRCGIINLAEMTHDLRIWWSLLWRVV